MPLTSRCPSRPSLIYLARRSFLEARYSSTGLQSDVVEDFRSLMRKVPQPVALVFTELTTTEASPRSSGIPPASTIHGATLSSFTSVSLHPYPIVSFSLRVPSRLATALAPPHPGQGSQFRRRFSVSLLSVTDQPLAHAFSRPDADHASILADKTRWAHVLLGDGSGHGKTAGGGTAALPVSRTGLGGAICEVLTSIPLWKVGEDDIDAGVMNEASDAVAGIQEGGTKDAKATVDPGAGSVLFIAKVLRVVSTEEMGEAVVESLYGDAKGERGGHTDNASHGAAGGETQKVVIGQRVPLLHVNRRYMGLDGEDVT